MRTAATILSLLFCACLATPALAAAGTAQPVADPPLRYSAELPPGDSGTPGEPGYARQPEPDFSQPTAPAAKPDAHPPMRYSVEDEGPGPLTANPPATPQPQAGTRAQRYSVQNISAPEQATVTGRSQGYRLGTGDKVHVTVYGESDLTGDYEVAGNGRIAFPLIGEVQAGGLTAPQFGNELTGKLSAGYLKDPRVAVEVTTYRPFYIIGQVNRPGRYAYADGMTAMNAVGLAGGFTSEATEADVYIRHEGQTKEVEMPANDTTAIAPGDVVRVAESPFWALMDVITPLSGVANTARYGLP